MNSINSTSSTIDIATATSLMQDIFLSALDPIRIKIGRDISNLANTPGTYLFRKIIEFNEETDKIIGTEKQITSTPKVMITSTTRQNNGALLAIKVSYSYKYVRDNVESSCSLYYEAFIEHGSDGNIIVTSLIPLCPEYEYLAQMSEKMIDEHFSRFDAQSFAKEFSTKMSQNNLYDILNTVNMEPVYLLRNMIDAAINSIYVRVVLRFV
jgi:hypothetical protein